MNRTRNLPLLALLTIAALNAQSYAVTTLAGSNTIRDHIPASQAFLRFPAATQVDPAGNIYIADSADNRVRRIDAAGIITTVAGTGVPGFSGDGGPATSAQLNWPLDIALDRRGTSLYIADKYNNRIRKVDLGTGIISTIAGNGSPKASGDNGPATEAGVKAQSIAVDTAGNLYFGDSGGNRIRKVDINTGIIRAFAGTGTAGWSGDTGLAAYAQIYNPWSVSTDKQFLYIAEMGNGLIRRVDLATNIITTYAGTGYSACPVRDSEGLCVPSGNGGPPIRAGFSSTQYVSADNAGNLLIMDGDELRYIPAGGATILGVAGSSTAGFSGDGDGTLTDVHFQYPYGIALIGPNQYLVADSGNRRLRRISNTNIQTIAGFSAPDGQPPLLSIFSYPYSAAMDSNGGLFIADFYNHRVRKATSATVSTVLGNGINTILNGGAPYPTGVALGPNDAIYVSSGNDEAELNPLGANGNRIHRLDATGTTVVAGTGIPGFNGDNQLAAKAQLNGASGLRLDSQGNLYIADWGNGRVRRVDAVTSQITTVAGNGNASASGENVAATSVGIEPVDLTPDSSGNLYIVDYGLSRIRKLTGSNGLITTIAGTGAYDNSGDGGPAAKASFYNPNGITIDSGGNLFVADIDDMTIRRIDSRTGIISRIAGTGDNSNPQDSGAALQTSMGASSILALPDGSLLVTDSQNDRIRKLTQQRAATLTAANQTGATGATIAIAAKVTDAAGYPVAYVPVTFAVTSGDARLAASSASTSGDGNATTQLTLGASPGSVTLRADSAGLVSVNFSVTIVVPFINASNGVTGLPMSNPPVTVLSPNGLMQVSGQGFLASGNGGVVTDADLVDGALPQVFHGVCVDMGGTRAALLAVAPNQIIFQVPALVEPGSPTDVSVVTNCGTGQDAQTAAVTLATQATAPEFFYLTRDFQVATAHPGDTVTVFATGLGTIYPAPGVGGVINDNLGVDAGITLQLGSKRIAPDWVTTPASLPAVVTQIAENVGVYLIQFKVPLDAPAGNLPLLILSDDGASSPAGAYLAVR